MQRDMWSVGKGGGRVSLMGGTLDSRGPLAARLPKEKGVSERFVG